MAISIDDKYYEVFRPSGLNERLLIAARDCFDDAAGKAWIAQNYNGIKNWADQMLTTDRDAYQLVSEHVTVLAPRERASLP